MNRVVLILGLLASFRLLVPPGICLCHAFEPASEQHQDHDQHAPGCPACQSASGWLTSPRAEAPQSAPLCLAADPPQSPTPTSVTLTRSCRALPGQKAPVYLRDCALRI